MVPSLSNMNQLHFYSQEDVPDHFGHAEQKIFMLKNAVLFAFDRG